MFERNFILKGLIISISKSDYMVPEEFKLTEGMCSE